ncbi:Transport and Golgi organization 2 -like protein [Toxocara canis]|uniref:Transport and Golgi organization 2-like protein n=1 Tax=Toxocara canis TaxID=6265 RepID=A0A0B2V205_TOXCA|nr:Transport and Golgi organization 2 -like protein [Toxocara canis]
MCVTFLYLNADAVGDANKYQLIVLNNRDEDFDRPTSLAAWQEGILAGRDEALPNERGGTWLGVKRDGRVGILLSMLEKNSLIIPGAPTRGRIVNEYLNSGCSAEEYGERIAECAHAFNGFNLLLLDRQDILIYLFRIYGFGNSRRQTPFKKVRHGTRLLEEKIKQLNGRPKNELIEEFIRILRDDTCHHPDEQLLSQTDQPEECSKEMSKLFYRFPPPFRYGTRSHTVVLIDGFGHVNYLERSQIPPSKDFENISWVDSVYEFDILD